MSALLPTGKAAIITTIASGVPARPITPRANASTSSGIATFSLAGLPVGTHNIYACFAAPINSGGTYPNMLPSCTNSTPQVITAIPVSPEGSATLLRSSANPSPFGNAVSFTASVQSTGAFTAIPTGIVTFSDGATAIGTATLDAAGTAVLTTSTLAIGTHPITAAFPGNTTIAASASAVLNEVIVAPAPTPDTGFLLKVTPTLMPVFVGATGVGAVQVIALTDFNQTVALTCSGLPAQASCVFANATIPIGGGTTEVFLSAGAPHNCNSNVPYFASLAGRGTLTLFSLAALTLCFARRRRKLQGIALAVLLFTLPAALSGCGTGCTNFAVKPGDYNFTITATAGTLVKTQAMVMHATLQ